MARRVSLPAADDLFRPTVERSESPAVRAVPDVEGQPRSEVATSTPETAVEPAPKKSAVKKAAAKKAAAKKPSGRVRHDEKMTVYITSDELLDIEHARLALRRSHGLAVDRGRIVREAVALVLAEFEAHGEESSLVRRLTEE